MKRQLSQRSKRKNWRALTCSMCRRHADRSRTAMARRWGKTGRNPDGIVDNHETIWPETEGREGLEQTFNEMLTGKHGEYKLTFDKDGRKTSEKLVTPPEPGYNVVTTLDLHLQELAEKALEAKAKRGAIVIVDPNNGDILALASWPTYDPNVFVPSISP